VAGAIFEPVGQRRQRPTAGVHVTRYQRIERAQRHPQRHVGVAQPDLAQRIGGGKFDMGKAR
jgi:hypothetical protein